MTATPIDTAPDSSSGIQWHRWFRRLPEGWFLLSLVVVPAAWSFRTLDFAHVRLGLLCVFLGGLALTRAAAPPAPGSSLRAVWVIGGLGGWMLLMSMGAAVFPHGLAMAAERLMWTLPVLLYGLAAADLCTGASGRRALGALTMGGLLITGLAFGQYAGLLTAWFPIFSQYDQPVYSVFGNQNFLGGYLAVCAGIALGAAAGSFGQALDRARVNLRPGLWLTAAGVLSSGVMLSASRTALLALAAAVGVALCQAAISRSRDQRVRRTASLWGGALAYGGFLTGCVILLLIFQSGNAGLRVKLLHSFSAADTGWQVRWWLWRGTLRGWLEHPLTGMGWNRFVLAAPVLLGEALWHGASHFAGNPLLADTTHSEPLQLLAETGLLGSLQLLLIAVFILRRVGLSPAVLPALSAFGVFSLFNSPLRDPAFGLAGLVLMLVRPTHPGNAGVHPSPDGAKTVGWSMAIRLGPGCLALICAGIAWGGVVLPGMRLRSALDAHAAGQANQALAGYAAARRHAVVSIRALSYENGALALLDVGQSVEARTATDQALRLGWDTGRLYWIRALAAERSGDTLEAERSAAACVRRWPFHEPAWELLLRNAPASRRPDWTRRWVWWLERPGRQPSHLKPL